MPVSWKHKILFLHIPKNAGKSFEIFLGIHDTHKGSPNSRSMMNAASKYALNLTSKPEARQQLMGVIDHSYAAQHMTLQEIVMGNFLTKSELAELQVVAIVRNPYQRAYSLFNHWSKSSLEKTEEGFFQFLNSVPSLREAMKHSVFSHFRPQVDYLRSVWGEISSVRVLRFEHLHRDTETMCKDLELDLSSDSFPTHIESDSRLRDAACSDRNKELIRELYACDFEHLSSYWSVK